jgi:hypothetical protein
MKKPFDWMHLLIIVVFFASVIATIAQLFGDKPLTTQTLLAFIPVLLLAVNNVFGFFKAPPTTLAGALSAGENVTKQTSQGGFARMPALLLATVTFIGGYGFIMAMAVTEPACTAQQVATATPIVVDLTNAVCQEIASATDSTTVEFICTELKTIESGAAAATVTEHFIVSKNDVHALAYFRARAAQTPDAGGQ